MRLNLGDGQDWLVQTICEQNQTTSKSAKWSDSFQTAIDPHKRAEHPNKTKFK